MPGHFQVHDQHRAFQLSTVHGRVCCRPVPAPYRSQALPLNRLLKASFPQLDTPMAITSKRVHPKFLTKIPIFNVWESLKNFGLSHSVAVACPPYKTLAGGRSSYRYSWVGYGKDLTQPYNKRLNERPNPGPDLIFQDAVIESQEFLSRENNCISTSRRARAGRTTINLTVTLNSDC